jgi:hypothetical protein
MLNKICFFLHHIPQQIHFIQERASIPLFLFMLVFGEELFNQSYLSITPTEIGLIYVGLLYWFALHNKADRIFFLLLFLNSDFECGFKVRL